MESDTEASAVISSLATSVQVLSVVAGVVISILSFNATRRAEAAARQIESAKPFLQLRQNLYLDAVRAAGVLANPDTHTSEELATAKKSASANSTSPSSAWSRLAT